MTEQLYCADCGSPMPADAQFCPACGSRQEPLELAGEPPPPAEQQPPPAEQQPPAEQPAAASRAAQGAGRRVEQVQPGAGELAAQIGRRLSTPGVILATICAAAALVACLVVGFVTAVATPDDSVIGAISAGEGLLTETLRLAVGTTMARVDVGGAGNPLGEAASLSPAKILPVLFLLVPLGAVAAAAYLEAARTAGMGRWARLLWPAASGIPLALVMLILALVAGGEVRGEEADFTIGSVLFYALLWGALGGVGGSFLALRRSTPEALHGLAPASARRWLPAVALPLRSLALLVAVMAVIGLVAVEVQVIKGEEAARADRSLPVAVIETVTFAGEWGVGYTGLGVLSEYNLAGGLTLLPPSDGELPDYAAQVGGDDPGLAALTDARGRIFDYSAALPPYVFVPGLVLLIALPLVLALYAGFVTARAMGAPTQLVAAGWGAVVGIVWALALTIVRSLGDIQLVEGASLFASTLLIGTLAGAVGGLLSGEGATTEPAPARGSERPPPPPPPPSTTPSPPPTAA
ncbi:MAG: zinc ribbon domain-containing protein [Solirubrobacteraceae bacterium MAG38_C4-C5]|nr:zinc ribbon domain-containing protein [Candidatus Siliceabacter maunaloa]